MRPGSILLLLSVFAASQSVFAQAIAVSCEPQEQRLAIWSIEDDVPQLPPAHRMTEKVYLDDLISYRSIRGPDGETREFRDKAKSVFRRCGPYRLQVSLFWSNDGPQGRMGAQVVPKLRVHRQGKLVRDWIVLDECYESYGLDCKDFGRKVVVEWSKAPRVAILRTSDSK